MLEFRTMHPLPAREPRSAAAGGHRARVTHEKPPRSTPKPACGRSLRKASLDELPQLWHVVRGQMSVAGPHPELAQVVSGYEDWPHDRHAIKPGLTGRLSTSEHPQTAVANPSGPSSDPPKAH